jgi:hypothetical protein
MRWPPSWPRFTGRRRGPNPLALWISQEILDLAIENFTEDRTACSKMTPIVVRPPTFASGPSGKHAARATFFLERQRSGFVRECHGDLHLGNIALVDGLVTIFDCIEFNEDMRWSDVWPTWRSS